MAFQFRCPQGHALETDESFAGQPCQCPHCGMTFLIPSPPAPQYTPPVFGAPTFGGATYPASTHQPGASPHFTPPGVQPGLEAPISFTGVGSTPTPQSQPQSTPAQTAEPEILHIPCPNGHELETPRDMLGQDVLCPHCQVQFRLREKDSVEYKRRREQELERRERKAGKMWLNYAIIAAVLVVLGLIVLIAIDASN